MKKRNLLVGSIIVIGLAFVLNACTMEKRIYMSGFHVEWNKLKQNPGRKQLVSNDNGKQTEQNQLVTVDESENETNTIDNAQLANGENITASVDNSIIPIKTRSYLQDNFSTTDLSDECDIIILRSGDEIKAKIIEIGLNDIKYKKCEYQQGPTYTLSKDKIFMIKYPDGNKDVFELKKEQPDIKVKERDVQTPNVEPSKTSATKKEELSHTDKCIRGTQDGAMHKSAWLLGGFLLGLIGVILAAVIDPKVPNNELSNDPAYRSCYEEKAKEKNTWNALAGWLLSLALIILILFA